MSGGGMTAELSGVPKPVLQTVFGRGLGRRIWQECRAPDSQPGLRTSTVIAATSRRTPNEFMRIGSLLRRCLDWPRSGASVSASPVADAEIVAGMIEYLALRAGETLAERGRQAKAIGLRMVYADGVSRVERTRLARPTNERQELSAAAISLFGKSAGPGVPVASVDLTVTSVQTEAVTERAAGLEGATVSAVAAPA